MAAEVGDAFVSLIPSARGFSRKARTELRAEMAGTDIPVRVTPNVDKNSVRRALVGVTSAAQGGGNAASTAFSSAFSGGLLKGVVVTALIAALAPPLAAAVTSALALGVGAGFLAIGALVLRENKQLTTAFSATADTWKKMLADAAKPLVGPFARALKQIGDQAAKLKPLFRAIFGGLAKVVEPLTAGLTGFATEILKAIRDAMPGIQAVFKGLSDALPGLGKAFGDFMRVVFGNPALVERTTESLINLVGKVLMVAAPLVRGLTVAFGALNNTIRLLQIEWTAIFDSMWRWLDSGTGVMGRLSAAWVPLKNAIVDAWRALESFAAASTDEEIVAASGDLIQAIRDLWEPFKNFLGAVWDAAWELVKKAWREKVVPWWQETVKPWLKREVEELLGSIFRSGVSRAVGAVSTLPRLAWKAISPAPKAILSGLGDVGGLLYQAGRSIVQGLINGIASKLPSLSKIMSQAASMARSFWPFSPAKQGPLSGHGSLWYAGRNLVDDLTGGMATRLPQVASASTQLAGAVGLPTRGGGALAPAPAVVQVGSDGSRMGDLLVEILREAIRPRGGNVQLVLGQSRG